MKKLLFSLMAMLMLNVTAMADDTPITMDKMPKKAQQFIRKHFGGRTVAIVTMDKDFMDRSYEVVFTNGDKVEFDKRGEWTNIDCEEGVVPENIVPKPILAYVNKNYPSAKVKDIDKERDGYEVELTNGWEIDFNKNFKVVELDR